MPKFQGVDESKFAGLSSQFVSACTSLCRLSRQRLFQDQ